MRGLRSSLFWRPEFKIAAATGARDKSRRDIFDLRHPAPETDIAKGCLLDQAFTQRDAAPD
jgi:hypothetical protein